MGELGRQPQSESENLIGQIHLIANVKVFIKAHSRGRKHVKRCSESDRGGRQSVYSPLTGRAKQKAPSLHIEKVDSVYDGHGPVEKFADILLVDTGRK